MTDTWTYAALFMAAVNYGLVPFITATVTAAVLSCAAAAMISRTWKEAFPLALAFASVGSTTGLFMGASRDSVVGAIVPAFLTVVSGLAVHQFAKRGDIPEKWRTGIPYGIVAMFTAAVASASFGAAMRQQNEQGTRDYEVYRLRFERVELPLELAKLKKDLGLPPSEK